MTLSEITKVVLDKSIDSIVIGQDKELANSIYSKLQKVFDSLIPFKTEWGKHFKEDFDLAKYQKSKSNFLEVIQDEYIIQEGIDKQQKHFKIEFLRQMVNFPDFAPLVKSFEKLQKEISGAGVALKIIPLSEILELSPKGFNPDTEERVLNYCTIKISGRSEVEKYCGLWLYRCGFSLFGQKMGLTMNMASGYINRNSIFDNLDNIKILDILK
ncbi:hypothetical protein [Cecembia lonarensis]|uniref:Uncharacterized protein n=1 Tax=Cecembia lonarensis (strain CCUG 58316 / KCTC 22772 / LW9) TaxID=1225176 RepID=K1KTU2_CECL9|nr:hypothetical protein [Cecembia lonarensis]EKB47615.1 hypothetical protein B879_03774 [Cecembia lonarensis LW9]